MSTRASTGAATGAVTRADADRASATLARNLAALDRVDPELAERIRLPIEGDHTRELDGGWLYRLNRDWLPLDLGLEAVDTLLAGIGEAALVRVLGVGCGELVERLLELEGQRVVAWERDPWLMRMLLARRDQRAELASGRLRLVLGVDLLTEDVRSAHEVVHPLLGVVYAREIALHRRGVGVRRAFVCAGGLFVDQVRSALESRGYDTWTLEVQRQAEDELARAVRRFRPELVFSINHVEGLAEFCAENGTTLVTWEIDPATAPPRALRGSDERTFLFTFRRAHVALFHRAGFTHVEHLPLAADPEARRPLELAPDETARCFAPLAFVGSSLVENARRCRASFQRAWQAQHGEAQPGEAVLTEILDRQRDDFAAFRVPAFLEHAAPGFRAAALERGDEDPVILAGEISASEKRLSWAANLGQLGLHVWGDPGWRAVERYGVGYRGTAGHRDELTRIYNACPLHWDVGRIYQPDIVTMRVFDVLACGRLVLAEHSRALEELFEVGVEVESYRTLAELQTKVVRYLEHPEEAERIAERGRAAVRARHTIAQRVDRMLECAGGSARISRR